MMERFRNLFTSKRLINTYYILLCAIAYIVIAYLQSLVTLYADDFYYSTFWNNGIKGFLSLSVNHYKTFNGRVLVHAIAQTVLALGIPIYAVFNTILLFLITVLSYKYLNSNTKITNTNLVINAATFAFFLMFTNVKILKESLLWISASYNYMFPVLLLLISLKIQSAYAASKKHSLLFSTGYILVSFISGATTEQYGIMSLTASLTYVIFLLVKKKTVISKALIAPIAVLSGYITIFLSPATRIRFQQAAGGFDLSLIFDKVTEMSRLYTGENSALPFLIIFCLIITIYYLVDRRRSKSLLLGMPVSALLFTSYLTEYNRIFCTVAFCVFVAFALYLTVLLLLRTNDFKAAILLLAGLSGVLIMIMTNTFGPRTSLPFILILCILSAYFCVDIFSHLCLTVRLISYGILLLLSLFYLFPTLIGYSENNVITKQNNIAIKQAQMTKTLYYCIDYNFEYSHSLMFSDGYFYTEFLSCYNLKDCAIYLTSERMKPIYVNAKRLTSPAYTYNGQVYFPVREIIESLGGSLSYEKNHIIFNINGNVVTLNFNTLTYINSMGIEECISIVDKKASGYYATCYTADVFNKAFRINITYNDKRKLYEVQKSN